MTEEGKVITLTMNATQTNFHGSDAIPSCPYVYDPQWSDRPLIAVELDNVDCQV